MPPGNKVQRLAYDDFIIAVEGKSGLEQRLPGLYTQTLTIDRSRAQSLKRRIRGTWFRGHLCPHCSNALTVVQADSHSVVYELSQAIWECQRCRFWKIKNWSRISPSEWLVPFVTSLHPHRSAEGLSALAAEVEANPTAIHGMTPHQMELFVGLILREHFNCDVHHAGRSHDGGIDLIVVAADNPIAVQVKRRSRNDAVEGVEVVRSLFASLYSMRFNRGMVVTTAQRFSKPAEAFVQSATQRDERFSIELVGVTRLIEMLGAALAESRKRPPGWEEALSTIMNGFTDDIGSTVTEHAATVKLRDALVVDYRGTFRAGTFAFEKTVIDRCWRLTPDMSIPAGRSSEEYLLKQIVGGHGTLDQRLETVEGLEYNLVLNDFPIFTKESIFRMWSDAAPGLVTEYGPYHQVRTGAPATTTHFYWSPNDET
jgi:hypothetical protein